ncbi:interleukin-37-like [Phyllostomus discolor]|uniref:Interleukin-1 n=1 Tax=Phyllostomus discolor TaxID=89673 RepID=A0A6J2LS98_9CHIR|nr:interleukin-37-like [Phyllostomus discolor]
MSFLEENAGVKMDSGDLERAEPQYGPEDAASGPLESGPSLASLNSAHAGPKVVTQVPEKFTIHDQVHKVLVLNTAPIGESTTLEAVPDRPYIRPAIFFSLPARFSLPDEHEENLIFLAVSEGDLCLYCEMDSERSQPTLQLKKQNLGQLTTWQEEDSKPFAFYRADVGSRNTLESAAYPGWFICTSNNWGEPVGMTNNPGQKEYIDFSFEPVKNVEMSPSEISK